MRYEWGGRGREGGNEKRDSGCGGTLLWMSAVWCWQVQARIGHISLTTACRAAAQACTRHSLAQPQARTVHAPHTLARHNSRGQPSCTARPHPAQERAQARCARSTASPGTRCQHGLSWYKMSARPHLVQDVSLTWYKMQPHLVQDAASPGTRCSRGSTRLRGGRLSREARPGGCWTRPGWPLATCSSRCPPASVCVCVCACA